MEYNRQLKNNLFNGKYQLVACDGSALDIFRDPDGPDTFFPPSGMSPKGYNQAYINACYPILDRRFTDLVIQPDRKRNEYSAFCQMVDAAGPRTAGSPVIVYICDRGYASYNNFAHVIENGQYFLIRCTDKKTEGILGRSLEGVQSLDLHVERILSRSQSRKKREHPELSERYCYVCSDVPMDYLTDARREYSISLRIIRVEISPGSFENLITILHASKIFSNKADLVKELAIKQGGVEYILHSVQQMITVRSIICRTMNLIWMTSRNFTICAGIRKMLTGISNTRCA